MHSSLGLESRRTQILVAVVCALSLLTRDSLAYAVQNQPPQSSSSEEAAAPKIRMINWTRWSHQSRYMPTAF